ncbi:major outer membrane protein FomA [Fusobacterium varium]
MRKLALLLGSLLVVASASAKEVVPAPVVVEEAPVQVIEKEVIVYRDKEVGFRPNGYVDLQYRWYGDTEGKNEGSWNGGANNYSRTQLQGKINMTEKQALEYRVRNYNDLNSSSAKDKDDKSTRNSGADVRLRYFYNHGNLGDSKVNLTSRVHYRDRDDLSGAQEVEYQARFNFAEYMFNNDFIKTTNFVVAPKYKYVWEASNDDDYDNRLGFDIASFHELPYGFSFELNFYVDQHFYGKDQKFDGERKLKDKNFTVDMEAYLYNTTNLYTNGNVGIDFNFEGGYDAYNWSQEKKFGTDKDENAKYSLYALPTIQVNYQATPNVVVYAAAGAEYRNWDITGNGEASHWRWQPTVFAGFKTTF